MIKPVADYIVIEPIKEEVVGGIIIAEGTSKEFSKGVVIATSEGKRNDNGELIPLSVKVGDKVLYLTHGPSEIKIEGKNYLIARDGGIIAIDND